VILVILRRQQSRVVRTGRPEDLPFTAHRFNNADFHGGVFVSMRMLVSLSLPQSSTTESCLLKRKCKKTRMHARDFKIPVERACVRVEKMTGGGARPDPLHFRGWKKNVGPTYVYVRDECFSWPPASAWTKLPLGHAWLRQLFSLPH
jgi:hypothetical protein